MPGRTAEPLIALAFSPRGAAGSGADAQPGAFGGRGGGASAAPGWRAWSRSWVGALLLAAICLAVYAPGLWMIPPVDRDESRFAQASRQMLESGDWVVPRIQDRPRLNKPPLIYWLQSASAAVLGDGQGRYAHGNIWVFRLPSALCAVGSVLLTWVIGRRLMDARAAWLGSALLAICPMVVWDAHQARADQLLLLTTTACMLGLVVVFKAGGAGGRGEKPRRAPVWAAVLFWGALGAGILAKGPITPMIAGLTALALGLTTRRRGGWGWMRGLRPLLGMGILAAVILPWVLALSNRLGGGFGRYLAMVWDETVVRGAVAKEGHWGPPGYHLVLLTVLLWPGSMLTGLGLLRAFRRAFPPPPAASGGRLARAAARLRSPAGNLNDRFLLAWVVPAWLVFELASTKLPHYTMPLYPALALVSARAVLAAHRGVLRGLNDRGTRIGFVIWWVVGAAATLGLSVVVIVAGRADPAAPPWPALGRYALPGALLVAALIAAGRSLARRFYLRAQVQAMAALVLWGATFLHLILPAAGRLWITPRIVAALEAEGDRASGPAPLVNASTYREDSLVFMTRGRVMHHDPADAGAALAGAGSGLVLMDAEAFDRLAAAGGARVVGRVRGYNYSTGREVELVIVQP